ncbi:DsbA family oxidoreductase [Alicyclobacillus ferrooxydans]|uniref:Disulfide bond formation protein DsbA n=1 Tax=Alicyclobacillus ferrooxydans TaxID=471514 RepID=A0A0P9ELX9_9BACL|nr:DsbA family oxidoreductase [Alicyclobacillus ferrooxydans]KPV44329.1 disulfide bond formation protein DsbA [Alicyclobacillus ferrooxydans]
MIKPKITVFSDFLCPFCYIGKQPLDEVAKEQGLEIEWRAFELRPEGVDVPPKPSEYMERVKAGVEALAKQYGLEMSLSGKSKASRRAHEGAKFAEEYGKAQEYHEAMFVAQFKDGRNVDDIDTLVDVATSIGLDPGAFREAVESRRYRDKVLEDERLAEEIGVTGIPCIIVENRGAMGVQSVDQIKALIEG